LDSRFKAGHIPYAHSCLLSLPDRSRRSSWRSVDLDEFKGLVPKHARTARWRE
jgi:hypothetical protein